MSEELTTEVTSESQAEQGIAVPEPETAPEGIATEEEGVTQLPSDVVDFEMPEKFAGKTAEEIAKSYIELEKFKGTTPTQEEAKSPSNEAEVPSDNKYFDEFISTGELSETSYEELAKQGYDKANIDERLGYEKYKQDQRVQKVVEGIGGMENYTAMEAWATENVSEEGRQTFTQEFTGASDYVKQIMLKDLYGQYQVATGNTEPNVVHTNESQYTVTRGYTSQHELQKDMSDRRYGEDRSFTEAVEAKLAKSNLESIV